MGILADPLKSIHYILEDYNYNRLITDHQGTKRRKEMMTTMMMSVQAHQEDKALGNIKLFC